MFFWLNIIISFVITKFDAAAPDPAEAERLRAEQVALQRRVEEVAQASQHRGPLPKSERTVGIIGFLANRKETNIVEARAKEILQKGAIPEEHIVGYKACRPKGHLCEVSFRTAQELQAAIA